MLDPQSVKDVASRYIAAYSEPSPTLQHDLLVSSLSRSALFISDNQELDFDGVADMATGFDEVASMRIVGDIRIHHGHATFKWAFTETSSAETTTGIYFCEFGSDGLIEKVVVFFD